MRLLYVVASDKRLWVVVLIAIVVRWASSFAIQQAALNEFHDPESPGHHGFVLGEDPAEQVNREITATRVPVVRRDAPPLGPLAAAVGFGGFVLLVGGVGAALLWRRD